jgi:hypothetical protein
VIWRGGKSEIKRGRRGWEGKKGIKIRMDKCVKKGIYKEL